MIKKLYFIMAVILMASLVLSACAAPTNTPVPPTKAPEPTKAPPTAVPPTVAPTKAPEPTKVPPTAVPPTPTKAPFKACEVTDTGGVDDKSFNATAWKGVTDAQKAYGIVGKYLESKQETDYEKNINAFLAEKCDIIISVGFLLGDATKKSATATVNLKQSYAIVDFTYDPVIPNIRGSRFEISQATFLAGYLAAAMTKTGKVGVYGGINIPPVVEFNEGYYQGIMKYNEVKKKNVRLLGWDPKNPKAGLFTGDFSNTDKGKKVTESLLDEGADIIMPVAGPVGAGTLAALKQRKTGMMIGVDTDWSLFYKDDAAFILASALKAMDVWVMDTIKLQMDGKFKGENYVGTLQNNGVGVAIGSAYKDKIPADLMKELDALKADIVAGKIKTRVDMK